MTNLAETTARAGGSSPLPPRDLDEAVALVRDWSELEGGSLLLTGCTGFFGRWLLETLDRAALTRGLSFEAFVLTRDASSFASRLPHLSRAPWLRLLEGDVRRLQPPTVSFTHVVAGAATTRSSEYRERPLEMISTIVDGTTRTMDIARKGNARRLLFLSSGVVHGAMPPGSSADPEDARTAPDPLDPLDPATTYAQAKRLAEHVCALAAADGSLVLPIARCWAFVGPGLPLDGHFAVGNFLRDALSGGPIRVAGDGTPLRSYLYGSDLAAWLLTLLLRGRTRAYDVGGDRVVSIRELADAVAALAGCSVEVARRPTPGAPADRYVPSIGRMAEEFGLRPAVGLEEGLRRTLAWHGFPPSAGGLP